MGLRDTISNLSPNEFLEKMQDMFQMYQESQDNYYSEEFGDKNYKPYIKQKGYIETLVPSSVKTSCDRIIRFYEKLYKAAGDKVLKETDKITETIKGNTITLSDFFMLAMDFAEKINKHRINSKF